MTFVFKSSKTSLLSLPTELLQNVAICAWATRDALALASSSRVLHGAIATPTLFQTRVREAGWDVEMWEEEASGLSNDQVLRLWILADSSCGAVTDMLLKAREPHCFERPDTSYQVWYPRLTFTPWSMDLFDCGEDENRALDDVFAHGHHIRLIDGERVWAWLTGFAKPFGHILTHNGSVSGILDEMISLAGDGEVWRVVLRTLLGLVHSRVLSQRLVILPSDFYPDLSPDLGAVLYNAFQLERFTSTFTHFVLSCDLADLERIFGAYGEQIWALYIARHRATSSARPMHERLFGPWIAISHEGSYAYAITETRRFSSSLLCIAAFFLDLRLSPLAGDTLSAPHLASLKGVRQWMSSLPQHTLKGTPFAELPNDGGRRSWGGYYSHYAGGPQSRRAPPMILELAVAVVQQDMYHLFGEGQDSVGSFTLSVRVSRRTGLFDGIKSYTHNQTRWDWRGCATPFGLVGRWGGRGQGGPVWIWPRDWSEA